MIRAHLVKFVGGPNDGHTSIVHAREETGVPERITVVGVASDELAIEGVAPDISSPLKRGNYDRSPLGDFFVWRGWED